MLLELGKEPESAIYTGDHENYRQNYRQRYPFEMCLSFPFCRPCRACPCYCYHQQRNRCCHHQKRNRYCHYQEKLTHVHLPLHDLVSDAPPTSQIEKNWLAFRLVCQATSSIVTSSSSPCAIRPSFMARHTASKTRGNADGRLG